MQPQDSTATAAAAVENRPQLEKRQSGVFENVLAQFGATSMKNIMLQSGTEGFTTDASKSSFEVELADPRSSLNWFWSQIELLLLLGVPLSCIL